MVYTRCGDVFANCILAQRKVLKRSKDEAREIALANLVKVGLLEKANAFLAVEGN